MSRAGSQRPSAVQHSSSDDRADRDVEVTRRQRRATGEIQFLILDAAREAFAEKGYARATTREIAARADVAETLLFRRFGSKAQLFGEAVLLPMAEFLEEYLTLTEPDTDEDYADIQDRFTAGLYDRVAESRGLWMTFFATGVFEPEVLTGHEASARVDQAIDTLADAVRERLIRFGVDMSAMDVRLSSRATLAMIIGFALFENWLLPRDRPRPSRDRVVQEITRQILYGGLNQRPATLEVESPPKGAQTRRPAR
jgi:AcrR family transcriptional regulator